MRMWRRDRGKILLKEGRNRRGNRKGRGRLKKKERERCRRDGER